MKDYVFPTPGEDIPDGYGLALFEFNKDLVLGLNVIGHGGNPIGYAAGALYLVDYGISIGITDNTEDGVSMGSIEGVLKVITEEYSKNL